MIILKTVDCFHPDKQELYLKPDKDNELGKITPVSELVVIHLQPEPEK